MTGVLYKFLHEQDGAIRSHYGQHEWQVGVWYKTAAKPSLCREGFHASRTALQALSYVKGDVLATVEVCGDHVADDNKEAWSEARLTAAYRWTARDSVALAVFAAELVLSLFEAAFPGDDRPRKAIEVAKAAYAAYSAAAVRADAQAQAAASSAGIAATSAVRSATATAAAAYSASASDAGVGAVAACVSAAYAVAACVSAAAADAASASASASDAGVGAVAACVSAAYAVAACVAACVSAAAAARGNTNVQARINDWIVARMPELETITGATP